MSYFMWSAAALLVIHIYHRIGVAIRSAGEADMKVEVLASVFRLRADSEELTKSANRVAGDIQAKRLTAGNDA